MSKKIIIPLLVFSLFLTACANSGKREFQKKAATGKYMDQPAADGNYYYQNKDLHFGLVLPPDFIYYQTQRVTTNNYESIEFFAPTGDTSYKQEVPGYGKFLTVKIFPKKDWQDSQTPFYDAVKKSKDRVYTLDFWNNLPADWQEKFDNKMRQNLIKSFQIL